MIISEIFGPTLQGEGPSSGRPCGFVRLGRCNLTCTWCDTPYTWDWKGLNGIIYEPSKELRNIPVAEVASKLIGMEVPMVVVTGGEPLIHRKDITELVELLSPTMRIEVETNGTLETWPELRTAVHQFNVGVKLANSGVEENRRLVPKAIESFPADQSILKFVVDSPQDIGEVKEIQQRFGIEDSRIWIMPEGKTMEEIVAVTTQVAPLVIEKRWNLTSRLQVQLWGDQRGV